MVTKHTPGPWWISGKGMIRSGKDQWVARCTWQNKEANAALIAAAPDMLAALEKAEQQLDYGQFDVAQDILRAAIAKARGQ